MVKSLSSSLSFPSEAALVAQALRFGHVDGPVGFFSALLFLTCLDDKPSVLAVLQHRQTLHYVAEVALELRMFTTSTGGFFRCDTAEPRAHLSGFVLLQGIFAQSSSLLLLVGVLLVF